MGYSREIYDKAEDTLSKRRQKAFYDAEYRREEIYKKLPRVREIERQITHTGLAAAKAVISGNDTKSELIRLRDENLKLQGELKVLLNNNGFRPEDLEEQYKCSICKDKGYIDGKMCSCMKTLLRDIAFKELNALSPLSLSSFDAFSLDYYSDKPDNNGNIPRKRLEKIYNFCKDYSENFSGSDKSILMEGGTGLGKTHLSLAIARRVIERGYGVIYCSVPNILAVLEKEHFSRDASRTTLRHLESCDLLILDDLGTEFSTHFTTTSIYNLINSRMAREKATIVNTNLPLAEVKKNYSDRLVSRIIGDHIYFTFIGQDVRIVKRKIRDKN